MNIAEERRTVGPLYLNNQRGIQTHILTPPVDLVPPNVPVSLILSQFYILFGRCNYLISNVLSQMSQLSQQILSLVISLWYGVCILSDILCLTNFKIHWDIWDIWDTFLNFNMLACPS